MRRWFFHSWIGFLAVALCGSPCLGQSTAATETNRLTSPDDTTVDKDSGTTDDIDPILTTKDRDGRIVTTEQVQDAINEVDDTDLRPNRDLRRLSPEIRRKLVQFQRLRERYLREQQRLIKEFKGATDEERQKIRERLRDRRERWLEQSRSIKESARERLRDLVRELPKHREALEAVRESVREQANDIRERRGQD